MTSSISFSLVSSVLVLNLTVKDPFIFQDVTCESCLTRTMIIKNNIVRFMLRTGQSSGVSITTLVLIYCQ